jgi:hypothetical protein
VSSLTTPAQLHRLQVYSKVTTCPLFSETVPEIGLGSRADYVPDFVPDLKIQTEIYIVYEI